MNKEVEEVCVKEVGGVAIGRRGCNSVEEFVKWAGKNGREDGIEPCQSGRSLARVSFKMEGGNIGEEGVGHGADVRTAPRTRGK
jgi:hypothetical protein